MLSGKVSQTCSKALLLVVCTIRLRQWHVTTRSRFSSLSSHKIRAFPFRYPHLLSPPLPRGKNHDITSPHCSNWPLILLQSANEIGDDVSPTNIISKLSLLVLHFPRLRIIWSRSLHATAEIFMSLKTNQDEPDEKKATRVGVPSEDGIVEDDVR